MVICENHSINVLKAPAAQAPAAALAPVKSLTTGQNDISYLTLLLLKGCFPERKKKIQIRYILQLHMYIKRSEVYRISYKEFSLGKYLHAYI